MGMKFHDANVILVSGLFFKIEVRSVSGAA